MKARRRSPEASVHPIHFEDRSGTEFERLCLAYLLRVRPWRQIAWYGQLGGDSGRDIWGVDEAGRAHCYQCANHQRLAFRKAREDIGKIIMGNKGVPDTFVLIVGGKVSAAMRDKIERHVTSVGIEFSEIWSGAELEERLRRDAPELIQRFTEGVAFPETVDGLRVFGVEAGSLEDADIIAAMAPIFDRPAFTTPFNSESSLPDFKKAITDTIEALNTGVRRLRDGTEIEQIPSLHRIKDKGKRAVLADIVQRLIDLRAAFDGFLRSGEIRQCGCGKPDCPVHEFRPGAGFEMDRLRREILSRFRGLG